MKINAYFVDRADNQNTFFACDLLLDSKTLPRIGERIVLPPDGVNEIRKQMPDLQLSKTAAVQFEVIQVEWRADRSPTIVNVYVSELHI